MNTFNYEITKKALLEEISTKKKALENLGRHRKRQISIMCISLMMFLILYGLIQLFNYFAPFFDVYIIVCGLVFYTNMLWTAYRILLAMADCGLPWTSQLLLGGPEKSYVYLKKEYTRELDELYKKLEELETVNS